MLTGAGVSLACCIVGYAAWTIVRVSACAERERKRRMHRLPEMPPFLMCLICGEKLTAEWHGLIIFDGFGRPVVYLCRNHQPWGFMYSGPGEA